MADNLSSVPGLVVLLSNHPPDATLDRLEAALKSKGIHVFARIDHSEGAREVGMPLRSTQVLLFGNPAAGTPLMQSNQTLGIDLPLKVLAWEDESGQSLLAYNDPNYLAQRHHITGRDQILKQMTAGLESLAKSAAAP